MKLHPSGSGFTWVGVGVLWEPAVSCKALKELPVGRKMWAALLHLLRPGQLHDFDELLFTKVLDGDRQARQLFLSRTFGPLEVAGEGDTLRDTLSVLAEQGFHLKQTARPMNIHISTLCYRLQRIQTLLGINLDDSEIRLQIQ